MKINKVNTFPTYNGDPEFQNSMYIGKDTGGALILGVCNTAGTAVHKIVRIIEVPSIEIGTPSW